MMSDSIIKIHADGGDGVIEMKQVGLAMSSIANVQNSMAKIIETSGFNEMMRTLAKTASIYSVQSDVLKSIAQNISPILRFTRSNEFQKSSTATMRNLVESIKQASNIQDFRFNAPLQELVKTLDKVDSSVLSERLRSPVFSEYIGQVRSKKAEQPIDNPPSRADNHQDNRQKVYQLSKADLTDLTEGAARHAIEVYARTHKSSEEHVDEAVSQSKTRNFKDQLIPLLCFIIFTVIPGIHSYYQDWNEYQHEAIQIIQTVNDFIETGKVNANHP